MCWVWRLEIGVQGANLEEDSLFVLTHQLHREGTRCAGMAKEWVASLSHHRPDSAAPSPCSSCSTETR